MNKHQEILSKFITTNHIKTSNEGYRDDSPDRFNSELIIPSGNITMKNRDGSPINKIIKGVDNLGNEKIMHPGQDYEFPGDWVKETPIAQTGGATRADSLALYNKSKEVEKWYRENGYKPDKDNPIIRTNQALKDNDFYFKTYQGAGRRVDEGIFESEDVPKSEYRKTIDKNKYYQRESADTWLNTNSPMQLYDKRIEPRVGKTFMRGDDAVTINSYNNISTKPFDLLTEKEKRKRVEQYGRDGVPKSYNPNKKLEQPVIVKDRFTEKQKYKDTKAWYDKNIGKGKYRIIAEDWTDTDGKKMRGYTFEDNSQSKHTEGFSFPIPENKPKAFSKDTPQVNNINNTIKPVDIKSNFNLSVEVPNIKVPIKQPKYYNIKDTINQNFGGRETDYKWYPENGQPLQELSPNNTRKLTPHYQEGGTWEKQQAKVKAEKDAKLKLLLQDKDFLNRLKEQAKSKNSRDLNFKTAENTATSLNNRPELISKVARNKTDQEIAEERQYIREQSNKNPLNTFSGIIQPSNWTRENLSDSAKGLESQYRVSDKPNFFDDWVNPANMIGNMASNLGQAPLQAEQSDSYMPYLTAIGIPLAVGAMAGLGTQNTGQFVNNLANPLAGTGDLVNNLGNKYLPNAYKYNPFAFKPNPEMGYRMLGKEGYEDALSSGVLRAKPIPNQSVEGISLARNTNRNPNTGKMQGALDRPYFADGFVDQRYASDYMAAVNKAENNLIQIPTHKGIAPIQAGSIPLENATIYKKDWLKGYKQVEVPNQINSSVDDVVQPITPKPWQMQELPGLHLKSTMEGEAISKIIEPKTGLINTEQALAIIGKESGGADKVALIRQGLGENIPKKMDYNEFRKTVQNQIVPLDVQINPNANSSYGISSIGYDGKNRDMKLIQKELQDFISGKNTDISSLSKGTRGVITGEGNISIIDHNTYATTGKMEFFPFGTIVEKVKSNDALLDIAYNKKYINSTPLENKTITFSNKNKFGKGSAEHRNPDETLGHAHYLIDAETPDIINLTQLQSDAFQGTHRIMPKTFNPERAKYSLGRMAEIQEKNIATLNKMKAEGAADYEIKQMQEIVDAQGLRNDLEKGHLENFAQKSLLDKDHQGRFLQEFVNHAAQRGDINKIRVPTSETAANVQGYGQLIQTGDNAPGFAKLQEEISIATRQGNQEKVNELMKVHDEMLNTPYKSYNSEHQTILKKYAEQPKTIKKLFGAEPKTVTDSKGNTWYEFDIPKKFKEGKGEIKAFGLVPPAIGIGAVIQSQNQNKEYKNGGVIGNRGQSLGWLHKYQDGSEVTYNGGNLNEVNIEKKSPAKGFWNQYVDTLVEDHKDDGLFGALLGTPIDAVLSLPQKAMMYGLTGKVQKPTEGLGIRKGTEGFAGDVFNMAADPLNLVGVGILNKEKVLTKLIESKESGLLSRAHKINPWAFKPNESNYYRQVSKEAIDDAMSSRLVREKGEVISPENYTKFQDQLEDLAGTKEYLNHEDKYRAMYNNSHGPMPYFQKGDLFYGDKPTLKIREKGIPLSERKTVNLDHLIESNYSPEAFQNAYGYKLSLGNPEEVGSIGVLKPNPELRNLDNFNLYKKHWLQGYKEVPKPISNTKSTYPSFKSVKNAPEHVDDEHLSRLIKKEADWLRDPEYIRRKMQATGKTEASIKKESEDIINNVNNTSIEYTGTSENGVSGLYSPNGKPKVRVFNGTADYYFYNGVLDHEVKHVFSETAFVSDPFTDFLKNTGYKNYPKVNLNKTIGDKVSSFMDRNWANLAPEQQVTGRRMMDIVENTQGVKRGTQLTDSNIEGLVKNLKDNMYNNADTYHMVTQFKRKFGENYKTHLKDFLNKAWTVVPGAVGVGAAASQLEQKKNGGIIKDDNGYWNPKNWGKTVEINSPDITMQGVSYPVLGVSKQTGEQKMMFPEKNYKFANTKQVVEYPMVGKGWLDKYN